MRVIKFRAWLPISKEMVVFGLPHINYEYGVLAMGTNQEKYSGIANMPDDYNQAVFMQFTGLHDKNGKEIYEGDIVRVLYDEDFMGKDKDTNCEVRYEEKLAMFVLDDGSGLTPDCFETDAELTVVGNVFENPELAGRTE